MGLRMDVHRAVKASGGDGRLRTWCWSYPGEQPHSRISYRVTIDGEGSGTLEVRFTVNGRPQHQTFRLTGMPCRFGGRRWLAVCPETGARPSDCCADPAAGTAPAGNRRPDRAPAPAERRR